jgi:hypothetical protein
MVLSIFSTFLDPAFNGLMQAVAPVSDFLNTQVVPTLASWLARLFG